MPPAVLLHGQTYLLAREMICWDAGGYERRLTTTLTHLLILAPHPE
jgi:hypothetical protein